MVRERQPQSVRCWRQHCQVVAAPLHFETGMLTGALSPTNGTATVAGMDIRKNMGAIRRSVGICLQHDCLFPELTVKEHVQFFARIKGFYGSMDRAEAEAHIDQTIQDVALYEKRNTYSRNLSGGMKRKLSVAIAFCGGSKTILLDEPTSGMDPFSRSVKDSYYLVFAFACFLNLPQEVHLERDSPISSGSLYHSHYPLHGKSTR